jgi:drug/metabolite transporter (DMT)-like permease
MQSVWLGTFFDWFINHVKPTKTKLAAIIVVLAGTALATGVLQTEFKFDLMGWVWGILSGLTFTATMYTSDRIAPQYSPVTRSLYMVIGSLFIVSLIWGYTLIENGLHIDIFYRWGILLAIFGTVLPPVLFARGFPHTGLGLGSIIAAIELPFSLVVAAWILSEQISGMQWLGIGLMLVAIVLMNIFALRKG